MALTPDQRIIAHAISVLASVSHDVLTKPRPTSYLTNVGKRELLELFTAVEARYPGVVDTVRRGGEPAQ